MPSHHSRFSSSRSSNRSSHNLPKNHGRSQSDYQHPMDSRSSYLQHPFADNDPGRTSVRSAPGRMKPQRSPDRSPNRSPNRSPQPVNVSPHVFHTPPLATAQNFQSTSPVVYDDTPPLPKSTARYETTVEFEKRGPDHARHKKTLSHTLSTTYSPSPASGGEALSPANSLSMTRTPTLDGLGDRSSGGVKGPDAIRRSPTVGLTAPHGKRELGRNKSIAVRQHSHMPSRMPSRAVHRRNQRSKGRQSDFIGRAFNPNEKSRLSGSSTLAVYRQPTSPRGINRSPSMIVHQNTRDNMVDRRSAISNKSSFEISRIQTSSPGIELVTSKPDRINVHLTRLRGETIESTSSELDIKRGERPRGGTGGGSLRKRKSAFVHTPWSPTTEKTTRRQETFMIPEKKRFYLCDCSKTSRKFSVACPGLYNLFMWLRFTFGRLLILVELMISVALARGFEGKHAWYFTFMIIAIIAPYILCWNVGLKLVYKSIYSSAKRKPSCCDRLKIITYIFPLTAIWILLGADISFIFFMMARYSLSVLRGDAIFKDTHSYLEEFRGVVSVIAESIPKAVLFVYILLKNDPAVEEYQAVMVLGFVIAVVNFARNLFSLIKQAERQSMSIFQYIFFRLQLAEVSMPAYVPDIFRIYEGHMKVGNYTDVEMGAESASQLISAVHAEKSRITTLRFADKTLRNLDNESTRTFGKSLENVHIIWTQRIKPQQIKKLWRDMSRKRRKRYVTKEQFQIYCEARNIDKHVDDIFDEMASTYDNAIYQRDFYEWLVRNQSEFEFGLLDVSFPLHHAILEGNDKLFMFFCGRQDAYCEDLTGQTPWMRAVQQQLPIRESLRFLRTDCIDISHKDHEGRTLIEHLMTASKQYIIEFLRHLLEERVNIVGLFYETFRTSSIPLPCIMFYFDDEFYESFAEYTFDYRIHVFDDYLPDYGFNSWVELIQKHKMISWKEIQPQWVGKYFDEHVIKWYIMEYSEHFSMHGVAEGLCQRYDGNEITYIIDCCPNDIIKDAVEEMTRTHGLVDDALANEFSRSFEEIGVPRNAMKLYFDEKFVQSLSMYLDYRSLFSEERLRSYGFKSFDEFIERFHPEQIMRSVNPRNIGRYHDARVIAWFLSLSSENNNDIANEIWKRGDENLFLLISCCNVPTILDFIKRDSVEKLVKKFDDIYDKHCPSRTIDLFFSEQFTVALLKHGFDFQQHVLKYIYKRHQFNDVLRATREPMKSHIHQLISDHEMKTREKRAKRMRCRENAIREFVSTEETFHRQMIMIINLFMRPAESSPYFTDEDIAVLFPPILLDIAHFSTELTIELGLFMENFDNETSLFSEMLEPFVPKIAETFYQYCVDFNDRLELRSKKEKKGACKDILIRGPGEQSFKNLQPIIFQRPPRYGLLMKEICKQTPEDHPDYHALKEVYKQVDKQSYKLNDLVSEAETRNSI